MNTRLGTSILVAAIGLAACGGDEADVELADRAVVNTPSMGMPPGGMQGGMGQMGGMGPGMMGAEWQQHMVAMQGATGDSLRAMMPMHRQMASRMIAMMDTVGGGMGMAMDSAMVATRDSLRRDLDRMEGMSPAEMEAFLQEHDARMQRMLRMHQSSP